MSITLKHGVDATDYHQLAKGKHFTVLETEFTRMIDQVQNLKKDIEYYKDRELRSRITTESNCERVMYFCLVGILATCVSGFLSFMETKKQLKRLKCID